MPALAFTGSEIFAARALVGPAVTQSTIGVVLDSGGNAASNYATFGPSAANKSVDCTISVPSSYTGGANPDSANWTNGSNQWCHDGAALRYSDSSNFAGMVLVNIAGNQVQYIDRVAGTETITKITPTETLAYDTAYRILIENSSGSSARGRVLNPAGDTLADRTWTLTTGVPASGKPCIHNYASKLVVRAMKLLDSSGTTVIDCPFPNVWASVYPGSAPSINGRYLVNGSALDLFCDGTNGSSNDWTHIISSARLKDGTIKGTLRRVTATRIIGITFRNSATGAGYLWYHDTSNGIRFAKTLTYSGGSAITNLQTTAATLTTGVDYPFTLTVSGSSSTFTINGVTYTAPTDTTYPDAGFFGVAGLQVNLRLSALQIINPQEHSMFLAAA